MRLSAPSIARIQEAWSDNAPVLQKPLLAAAHSIGRFLEHADFDRLTSLPQSELFVVVHRPLEKPQPSLV